MMVPADPTTQTSSGPVPHGTERNSVVPLGTAVHVVPFQCRTMPPSPSTQTSLGPLPHTPGKNPVTVFAQIVPATQQLAGAAPAAGQATGNAGSLHVGRHSSPAHQ